MKKRGVSVSLILVLIYFCIANINARDLKILHEKTYKISPGKTLELETSVGDVEVTGWDKNEVYVKISGNPKAEEDIEFYFKNSTDKIQIKGELDRSFWNNFRSSSYNLHYEIKVPDKFNTKVSTSGGDLIAANITGETNFNTSGGDIRIRDAKGKIKMSTSGGDIDFKNVQGNMKFTTSGGEIFGNNFYGNLKVSTSGGDLI